MRAAFIFLGLLIFVLALGCNAQTQQSPTQQAASGSAQNGNATLNVVGDSFANDTSDVEIGQMI